MSGQCLCGADDCPECSPGCNELVETECGHGLVARCEVCECEGCGAPVCDCCVLCTECGEEAEEIKKETQRKGKE